MISTATVQLLHEYTGRGPTKVAVEVFVLEPTGRTSEQDVRLEG
jgi:hypothetical protein